MIRLFSFVVLEFFQMTSQQFSIRILKESDINDWFRLRTLLWDEASEEEHQAEMSDILQHPDSQLILVAEDDSGGLIGFLEASIRPFVEDCHSENVGYLEGWYVQNEFRRSGVGRMLVKNAESWAKSHGCEEMASDSEIGNDISVAAHENVGYIETSRLVHWRKEL
jgi:aminoglycoside 6'-N-acetyltransferase I